MGRGEGVFQYLVSRVGDGRGAGVGMGVSSGFLSLELRMAGAGGGGWKGREGGRVRVLSLELGIALGEV